MKLFPTFLMALALSAMLGAPAALAETIRFSAAMSPTREVPPVVGNGNGMTEATLDTASSKLKWKITYSDLSSPATKAHFHGPAGVAEKAGVAVDIKGNLASPIQGEATLTSEQTKDLMAGKWYVNIHTAANPGGELRGQLQRN
jgi:hypothetical protein